ncbi:MAG: hypothetical protein CL931_17235 [Deltaproteobacteria bacterium]|nr:hypothetical protein [Deltaproteobacteria bacterium]
MDGITAPPLPTVHSLGDVVTKNADEKTALKSFEAYIVGEMLLRAAPKDEGGIFSGGEAGKMYQDHLYQEYARLIAEDGRFGLAQQLEGQLDRARGEAVADAPALTEEQR